MYAVNYVQFFVHHLFSVVSCHPNLIATLSVARAVDYTALLEHRMNRLVIIKINQTIQYKITKILSSKLYHTADTICSHFAPNAQNEQENEQLLFNLSVGG